MLEHRLFLFVSVCVYTLIIGVSSIENVPVYMWENTGDSQTVPALTRVTQESFKNILVEQKRRHTPIIVFAEKNLSPEDFILHDADGHAPYFHLSELKSTKISYWPFVQNPIKVVKELPDIVYKETSIKAIIEDPSYVLGSNDVLIMDMNDAKENEDRLQMLKRHDQDMKTICNRFAKQHKNIITILTSVHSSWITSEDLHRRARDTAVIGSKPTEMEPADTSKIYVNDDILIYISSPGVLTCNSTKVPLDDFTISTEWKNATGMVVVFNSAKEKDIVMKFEVLFGGGYWKLENIIVNNASATEVHDKEYNYLVKGLYVPLGFSYHCYKKVFANFANPNKNVLLPGLQMQAYENTTNSDHVFGDAFDCVGFMSAPIWSGIFVTFILALIMTFGLTMMMDIKTMDRFDDPKGKTISINAAE